MSVYVTRHTKRFIPDHLRITGTSPDHRLVKTPYNGISVIMIKDGLETHFDSVQRASLVSGITAVRIKNCIRGATTDTDGILWKKGATL